MSGEACDDYEGRLPSRTRHTLTRDGLGLVMIDRTDRKVFDTPLPAAVLENLPGIAHVETHRDWAS